MNRHVAAHGQALAPGGAHQLYCARRGEPAKVHARTGGAHELEHCRERDGLGEGRDAGKAEPRGELALVRDAVLREPRVLRPQPHGEAESGGVLQRAPEDLRIGKRSVRLRERDAARLGELRHLGEPLAFELHGERAERVDTCAREGLGAPAQHVDESRLIERRVGVGRTGEARHAARKRRFQLRFERRLVFESRLAQPRREVDEAGCGDEPLGVDHPIGPRMLFADLAVGDMKIAHAVAAARRIDDARILDREPHA